MTIEGYLPRVEIKSYVRYIMRHQRLNARQAWAEAHRRYVQTKKLPDDFKFSAEASWQD